MYRSTGRALFCALIVSALFVAPFLSGYVSAQASISPTTWGGTSTNFSAAPSTFSPLPATGSPGAAAVAVSQWNRGPGINYNTATNRYNSRDWTLGASTVSTVFANGDYIYFTVTNNSSTQLNITGVNIGSGQTSSTGPTTFGLIYRIGSSAPVIFDPGSPGSSPVFTGTAISLCAGETITFYLCGWGGSNTAGTWSINNSATITAQWITAVTAVAGSTSPVLAGTPLAFTGTPSGGVAPYTYLWSGPAGYSNTLGSPSIAAPLVSASGVYSLTVTDAWGCSAQATTTATVNPSGACSGMPAGGTANAVPGFFCGVGSSTVTVTGASAMPGISYQWISAAVASGPYSAIPGATSTTYSTPSLTSTTYYRCIVTCAAASMSDTSTVATVIINPLPVITPTPASGMVCSGGAGLALAASGASTYVWSPATGLSASTGTSVTANPVANTTYTITGTDLAGCVGVATVTVNYFASPAAITPLSLCVGGTATMTCTPSGGTWASSNANVAIDALSGVATGMVAGTSVISYLMPSGCYSTTVVTVNPLPATISGTPVVCEGGITILTCSTSGGAWSSSNGNVSVAGGTVNGVTAGTSTVSYTLPTGCFTAVVVTVNPVPTAITGVTTICEGSGSLLGNSVSGGTWTSSTVNATVDASTGFVSGISAGTANITYTIGTGCFVFTQVTINTTPPVIGGANIVCEGRQIPLSNTLPGGVWSSGSLNASVDASGLVTGVSAGTAQISYSLSTGCEAVKTITINMSPAPITGSLNVCMGSTTLLGNSTAGGAWTGSNTAAAIGGTTGIVSGLTAGTATVVYTISNGCFVSEVVTVNPLPAPIIGPLVVCQSYSVTLTNGTGSGTWTASNSNITVGASTGSVTGNATGTSIVTYTLGTGCFTTRGITVNPLPAAITGPSQVCVGDAITLSNATSGGTWSVNNGNASIGLLSGITNGIAGGSVIVSYTALNGCFSLKNVTVNQLPGAIAGSAGLCTGRTTNLNSSPFGGTWTSTSPNASVNPVSGVVSGVSVGTADVTYTLPTGCFATKALTVNLLPGPITGSQSICETYTTLLTDTTAGGTWSSDNAAVANIDPSGLVTGLSAGSAIISYALGNGCAVYTFVTVNPVPLPVTGPLLFCQGATVTFSSGSGGGTWSTSDNSIATISGLGSAFGVSGGPVDISYTLPTGCFSRLAVTVNPLPSAITGSLNVCAGFASNLHNATSGGYWSGGAAGIASIHLMTGVVTGISPGTAIVSYGLMTGCTISAEVTVNALPPVISGSDKVCVGASVLLSNSVPVGTWTCSNPLVATVDAASGLVSGIQAGAATITYTIGTGCFNVLHINVHPLPGSITGVATVCEGSVTGLMSASTGGTWQSNDPTIATAGLTTGFVTGVAAGTVQIIYTLPTTCSTDIIVTVNQSPAPITGDTTVCLGAVSPLGNGIGGGTWSSSNPLVAPIDITGAVFGLSLGTSLISYVLPVTSCQRTVLVSVLPLPNVFGVTGGGSYCAGGAGVVIGLDSSDAGTSYSLMLGSLAAGYISGTGSPISFGMQATAGVYAAIATDAHTGCQQLMSGTATVAVTPLIIPSVSILAAPADSVCPGETVTLIPQTTTGGSAPTYTWFVNGVAVGAAGNYSFIPADGDVVTLQMSSNATCLEVATGSANKILTVMPYALPVAQINVGPNDTVCQFSPVTFTAVPSFEGNAPVYTWFVDGIASGTGISYTTVPDNGDEVSLMLESSYRCRLQDTVSSAAVIMQVDSLLLPHVAIYPAPGLVVEAGKPVTLLAVATDAGPAPSFQWKLNGHPVSGATNDTYTSIFNDYDSIGCVVTSSGVCNNIGTFDWVFVTVSPLDVVAGDRGTEAVRVFPNPNTGTFRVKGAISSGITGKEPMSIIVRDMLGQTVYVRDFVAGTAGVDETVSLDATMPNGVYILTVSAASGSRVVRIVINR